MTAANLVGAPLDDSPEFWLFGYGSLIWKPPPHFDKRVPGWVTGYVRRFWQASEDHRGTPQAPGRVVTLIDRAYWTRLADAHDSPSSRVWGVAYRILPDHVAEVKDYLDIREINGYSIHFAPFCPADGSPEIRALVYIGTPENNQFVGPQDPDELARHILLSHGPSGSNKDYLYYLQEALDELSPASGDQHVSDLVRRVRALEAQTGSHNGASIGSSGEKSRQGVFKRQTSTTEAEEIEKS